ncbi:MAG: zf-HC2 domain-containing protein [Acidimicrobiia bacterium]
MNREPTMPGADVLSAYLDGECTDAERVLVEEQLASSEELRDELAEARAARDAVRALPLRDAPPEFWARMLAADPEPEAVLVPAAAAAPVDLAERRARRSPSRWLAAAAGAAAAAVIAVVVLVPQPQSATPPVGAFTAAHAVRSSLQDDAVSSLAPLAVSAGFRR